MFFRKFYFTQIYNRYTFDVILIIDTIENINII